MASHDIEQVLNDIRAVGVITVPDMPMTMTLHCTISEPIPWNKTALEESLEITLPDDVEQLWTLVSSLCLFEDITYGQWGLVIWSPDQVVVEHKRHLMERPEQFRQGDLIIGEFLGDSDLLLIRCNPIDPDFGYVIVALPLYQREEWDVPSPSLTMFLRAFLDSRGGKFWEG